MDGFTDRALAILAIIASIFLLHWGAPFFIPLAVSLIIAFALSPVVDALTRVLRWRLLSATVVVAGVLALLAAITWSWRDDVERIWDHAAGALIAAEAGCLVSDAAGRELDFSHGRGLERNRGIVVAEPQLHGRIIEAIRAEGAGA